MSNMVGVNRRYQALGFKKNVQWVFEDNANDICSDSESIESTIFYEDSTSTLLSSSSSQAMVEELDDASSSTSSSSTTSSGPLYKLSQLMEHLPIKRGLSNYYQGKSQSFTSLASVKSLEDLAKKENPYKKKVKKPCNKYSPKAIIKKKPCSSSRGSNYFASSLGKNRVAFVGTSKYL